MNSRAVANNETTLVVNNALYSVTLQHKDNAIHLALDCLSRLTSKEISKLRVTGPLCRETGGFPSQRASNTESVSISWRHHELSLWSCCSLRSLHQFVCLCLKALVTHSLQPVGDLLATKISGGRREVAGRLQGGRRLVADRSQEVAGTIWSQGGFVAASETSLRPNRS